MSLEMGASINRQLSNARALKVFLSYSRKDESFARELFAGLELCGFDPFIDKEDIAAGEDWELRLSRLIENADTVVYVISSNSTSSKRCGWEIERSNELNKRILPVVWQRVDESVVPDKLKRLNYIYFDQPHSFGPSLATLAAALRTDLDWLREHTRIGERAIEWDLNGRSEERLLRGEALSKAIDWLGRRPVNAPEPSPLQRAFLAASEDAEAVRAGLQERQLKEIAEAQASREIALRETEKALENARLAQKSVARSQRRNGRLLGILTLIVAGWLGVALRQQYINSEREARVFTSLANNAFSEQRYDSAMRLALQGLPARGSVPLLTHSSLELEAKLAGAAHSSRLMATLGHSGLVADAKFDATGTRIATASYDGSARVWMLNSLGDLPKELPVNEEVNSVDFSPDGLKLVAASATYKAYLWTIGPDKPVELPHEDTVQRAVFSPNGANILTVSRDRSAKLWSGASGNLIATFLGHIDHIVYGEFSRDGRFVVTASQDGSARVWKVEGAQGVVTEAVAVLQPSRPSRLETARFNQDGTRILTASNDRTARLWSIESAAEVFPALVHDGGVFSAIFSPDGSKIATAEFEGKVRIFDSASGKPYGEPLAHSDGPVRAIAFDGDGGQLFSAGADGQIRIWSASGSSEILRGHSEEIFGLQISTDGEKLLSASGDGTARIWSVGGVLISEIRGQNVDFAVSVDQKHVLTVADDGVTNFVELESGRTVKRAMGPRQL